MVLIQLNWILQTAKYKEEVFNEKASIVFARTTEVLALDKSLSKKIETGLTKNEKHKTDSLIRHFANYYNLHENYIFELKKIPEYSKNLTLGYKDKFNNSSKACYQHSIDSLQQSNNWQLKIAYPNHKSSVLKEMGLPFLVSIILILMVLFLFWRTIVSLIKEKKISEHTIDFLNNMTHEFNTPLTSISLAGQLIIKDAILKKEDEIKLNTDIILEENEKLRLQVERVLNFSALDKGELFLNKVELDFHLLLKNILKSIVLQIDDKLGHLKLELDAKSYSIKGDKMHLSNAIRNVIDNSIKYSIESPEIIIQTLNTPKKLVIMISDKGIGIEREYHEKVFEKYFRIPKGNVHDVKGFGLGLAYTKKIVELHGGKIDLQSNMELGTIFTITLPND